MNKASVIISNESYTPPKVNRVKECVTKAVPAIDELDNLTFPQTGGSRTAL